MLISTGSVRFTGHLRPALHWERQALGNELFDRVFEELFASVCVSNYIFLGAGLSLNHDSWIVYAQPRFHVSSGDGKGGRRRRVGAGDTANALPLACLPSAQK